MRRRELLLLIGAVALLPGVSRGEQQRRIGFLGLTSKAAWANSADFRQGLAETGYIEGRNLVIDYRWAEGHYDRLLALAAELVSEKAEAISTEGGPAPAKAAMQATTTIPIVGSTVASLVKHFNRPEGNLTGVSIVTGDLMLKRLQILTEIVPGAKIGVLMNPASTFYDRDRKRIEDAAAALGVKLVVANLSADADFDPAFASLDQRHVGALMPEPEPFLGSRGQLLATLAARYKVPMMQEWREAVAAGGLISYGPSLAWVFHQVGHYTGQILNGAEPAGLPVVVPARFELVINLKTAKALGLTIPPSILAGAGEVIE